MADALGDDLTVALMALGLALADPNLLLPTRVHLRQAETALLAAAEHVRLIVLAETSIPLR